MSRIRAARLAVAATALLGGCALDRVNVAQGDDGLVVHAVLTPSVRYQYVLVERVLSGRVAVANDPTGGASPIVDGGGVPVTGAVVELTGEDGLRATAIATAPGVYRFDNTPFRSCGGGCSDQTDLGGGGNTFTLRVSKDGRVATGRTTIPGVVLAFPQIITRDSLDRTRDTISVPLPPVVGSARYLFRVGTPYGPFELFTDSTVIHVPGTLVNPTAEGFPPAFVPGFRQSVIVAAVDQNYFDYYRSGNSPFTGAGLISHLDGGIGLVGSMKVLDTRRVEVRAPFVEPIDGRYVGGASGRDTLELWAGAAVGEDRLVSGDLRAVLPDSLGTMRSGVLGSLAGGVLTIRVLRGEVAEDVAYTLVGILAGRRLTMTSRGATLTFDRVQP